MRSREELRTLLTFYNHLSPISYLVSTTIVKMATFHSRPLFDPFSLWTKYP